jgi:hypothetical protein
MRTLYDGRYLGDPETEQEGPQGTTRRISNQLGCPQRKICSVFPFWGRLCFASQYLYTTQTKL